MTVGATIGRPPHEASILFMVGNYHNKSFYMSIFNHKWHRNAAFRTRNARPYSHRDAFTPINPLTSKTSGLPNPAVPFFVQSFIQSFLSLSAS
jgi:hypothetical protein